MSGKRPSQSEIDGVQTSSKGLGIVVFTITYIVYIIGYTITNMTAQTLPAIMTNDPRQRPTIGVWTTAMNYLVPMIMTVVLNMVLLPRFGTLVPGVDGGDPSYNYNQSFLTAAVWAKPQSIRRIVLKENILYSQRVEQFSIDAEMSGGWQEVYTGTVIGYKRIVVLPEITTTALRIQITDARCAPHRLFPWRIPCCPLIRSRIGEIYALCRSFFTPAMLHHLTVTIARTIAAYAPVR